MESFAINKEQKKQVKKVRQNLNKVRRTFLSYCFFLAKFYSPFFLKSEKQIVYQLFTICLEQMEKDLPNENTVINFETEIKYYIELHKVFKSYLNKSFRLAVVYVKTVYINKEFSEKEINEKEFYNNIKSLMNRKGLMFEFAKNNTLINL